MSAHEGGVDIQVASLLQPPSALDGDRMARRATVASGRHRTFGCRLAPSIPATNGPGAIWIMVAGRTLSSGGADAAKRAGDRGVLRAAALAVHRCGHVLVVGVDMALPIAAAAGHDDAVGAEATMSIALALADRRGARPRTGGPSDGADEGAKRSKAAGRPLSRAIGGVPGAVGP
jgi:hypothetical protein